MKVYITKYALSDGILERTLVKADARMAVVERPESINDRDYFHGKDWHYSLEDAQARAREMRDKRLKNLRKQIKKLEAMEW